MAVTDAQVRKFMSELAKHGRVGKAALRAGMDRKTARKYRDLGKRPSELKEPRSWRTREDPFAEDWEYVRQMVAAMPELEAKSIFEHLQERRPERYVDSQVRTLQRRLRRWRAQEGPSREVFFVQAHRPGEAMQTDFTSCNELQITIAGEGFPHLLCHCVLPYSNWEWATVCRSESMKSLQRGVQAALFQIGRRPEFHQTDNSTAATHSSRREDGRFVARSEADADSAEEARARRKFNERYLEIMAHFGLKPRVIGVGKKEQNGDVEALNGALKRRINQRLLLRGNRDFESVAEYETWLQTVVLEKANRTRTKRFVEELEVMAELRVERLPEFSAERVRVTLWSTVRILHNTYSVPSRLVDEELEAHVYDDRIEFFHDGSRQLVVERLLGINHARVDYRHVIDSLVLKPGGFARYRFREQFFPTTVFRRAFDALHEGLASSWQADLEYLRMLQLAARTLESEVQVAVELLLEQGEVPRFAKVEGLVAPKQPSLPDLAPPEVDLKPYDRFLGAHDSIAASVAVSGGLCPPGPPEFFALRAPGSSVSVVLDRLPVACSEDRALLESNPSADAGGRTGEAGSLAGPASPLEAPVVRRLLREGA